MLTDKAIKAFIAKQGRGSKLAAGEGMFLIITSPKKASWRYKYRIDGKEKSYTIGTYPSVSLAAARLELADIRAQVKNKIDPNIQRQINRAEANASIDNTFKLVAIKWLEKNKSEWSDKHFKNSSRAFERDIFPDIGMLPVATVSPAIIAKVIEDICKRGSLESATRILQHVNGVFRFAQAKGLCRENPAIAAKEVLPKKKNAGHIPALLDFVSLGDLLRRADRANISPSVRMAHRLCAFTAARIGTIINAEWKEFDLKSAQPSWNIPREKMKVKSRSSAHRIPLGSEIVNELLQWKNNFGNKGYVFPSPNGNNHIGSESIEKVYRVTLGLRGKHSPHSWRSSFSTLARDSGFSRDAVELALDHVHDNEVARAYDRGDRFIERVKLFTWWGKQLVSAQKGAEIIPLKKNQNESKN